MREHPTLGTINHALVESARHDAGFVFLDGAGVETAYRYEEVLAKVRRRARHLLDLGLRKGDRIGLIVPEAEEFVLSFLASLWAGIVPVPAYPPLVLGKLASYVSSTARILQAADASALLTTRKLRPLLWPVTEMAQCVRAVVTVDRKEEAAAAPLDGAPVRPEDLAFLQFTSGSTADPKGVMVTHANLTANCSAFMHEGLRVTAGEKALSWLPLYHDMGLIGHMLGPLVAGVTNIFIPPLAFLRRPSLWMDTVHRHRAAITTAPNFGYALLGRRAKDSELSEWDLSCIRVMMVAAEPIQPRAIRAFLARFERAALAPEVVLPCYGLAESTLAVTFADLGRQMKTDRIDGTLLRESECAVELDESDGGEPRELVSCGRAFSGHEVAVVDGDDNRLPERRVGEIVCRGPSVSAGYFRRPDASAETFRSGWLYTGDLGYIADGELYVCGRLKDVVILNGRNYDPQTVEWVVEEVEGVRKGNVVAFSIEGESSEELVVVAESREADHDELSRRIAAKVNEVLGLRVGATIILAPGTMPKTTSGKLQRRRTRSLYREGNLGREARRPGDRATPLALPKHLAISFASWLRFRRRIRITSREG